MPWCPNCKTEYQDGYTVCSDCGSTLVESLEQAAAEEAAEYIRDAAASFPDDTGFEDRGNTGSPGGDAAGGKGAAAR